MSASFDPYGAWLGIPPDEQPPTYYRLLDLQPLEANPDRIRAAAERQIVRVSGQRLGRYAAIAQRVLSELVAARDALVDPQAKAAYDAHLGQRLAARPTPFELPAEDSSPVPIQVAAPAPIAPPPSMSPPHGGATPPLAPPPGPHPALGPPPVEFPPQPFTAPGLAPLAQAGQGTRERRTRRRFWLKAAVAVLVISAGAAISGAMFLNSVLRRIDQSRQARLDPQSTDSVLNDAASSTPEDADAADQFAVNAEPATATMRSAKPRRTQRPTDKTDDTGLYEDDSPPVLSAKPADKMPDDKMSGEMPGDGDPAPPPAGQVHRERGAVLCVAISPDGHEAVSIAEDPRRGMPNSLRFWNLPDGGVEIERPLPWPADAVVACYGADSRVLWIGTAGGKAQIVALDSGEVLAIGRGAGPPAPAVATRNGAFLFARPGQSILEGWDRLYNPLRVQCTELPPANCLAISSDNTTLLTASVGPVAAGKRGGAAPAAIWQVDPKPAAGGAANEPRLAGGAQARLGWPPARVQLRRASARWSPGLLRRQGRQDPSVRFGRRQPDSRARRSHFAGQLPGDVG